MAPDPRPFAELDPSPDLPALERAVLERWEAEQTFNASLVQREGAPEFVFYDGPPFANGLPHYGHLLTGYVKDAVPRYQTMRGRHVSRRFGWDCHGLPPEMEAERELQLTGRAAIQAFGVARFNDHCRASVQRYTKEWERYVTRQARWVDFEDDYRTMDLPYMESVLWAFKALHDKGLLYEGYRVLPYCWECETPLSNFETKMDDAYRDRQDPAVTVRFRLRDGLDGAPTDVLAWTTTPWTLPSNLALAVGPQIDYAVVEHEGGQVVVAASRVASYERELGGRVVRTLPGSALVGMGYEPLFPFFAGTADAFCILAGDFVTDGDGTGIVHIAPGFGEDDKSVGDANGIPVVVPVDDTGRFTAEVADFAGLQVFEANRPIIRALNERGLVVREDSYVHSYPHCWRTDTPLIYRAVSSWFVAVTKIKDRLLELNQEISWVPENVRDGAFGSWLEGARDWSISRNRFWGAPLPVWKSDDPAYPRVDVYGSLDELERDFGVRPDELHRPVIDLLTRPNPDDPSGRATMRRVGDVLDCWFESGSMPYAQVHYPFENKDWFEENFPADFVVEYVGQTRGWFYTLHVLSVALFDRPPFRSCLAHGIVLGSDRRKLSKRLRNYPDPLEEFERVGSDAIRWSLLSSSILRGGNLIASEAAMEAALREAILPLWHTCRTLTLYAEHRPRLVDRADDVLDRYALAKAADLVQQATTALDAHDLPGACWEVSRFLDALNNWYVRRSRDRLWAGDEAAVDTLFTVLHTLLRVTAPLMPLTVEHLWASLVPGAASVHLQSWPRSGELPVDPGLVEAMDRVRDVCSAGHAIRKGHVPVLRTRLPLPAVTVAGAGTDALEPFRTLIAEELNVRDVRLTGTVDEAGELVLTVNPRVAGPRLGKQVQEVIRAARSGDWSRDGETVAVGGVALEPGEFELRLLPRDETTSRALPGDDAVVALDVAVTAELEAEGVARDVVRLVQEARRAAGLDVRDRIVLRLQVPPSARHAVESNRSVIAREVLAEEVGMVEDAGAEAIEAELASHGSVRISLRRTAG
ncbi:MAG: Isoleucyl-tRNA synthetase [uncultured Acidimicrobiales bacterium]|uniref:Isoleucine--tRNA ligase n=1 Tax=uncultured Acidimicrobiales bacterium TaxID=310071 RepID=A0A6J4H2M7_9ACTN|nr:MAG: Isoleucyl-tRNA synthetase [uncultured Acidimicrobiales bacterium]